MRGNVTIESWAYKNREGFAVIKDFLLKEIKRSIITVLPDRNWLNQRGIKLDAEK